MEYLFAHDYRHQLNEVERYFKAGMLNRGPK